MMRGSLSEQLAKLEGLLMPKPLHPKRHATALKIAVALHRAERATKDPHTLSALKELHPGRPPRPPPPPGALRLLRR